MNIVVVRRVKVLQSIYIGSEVELVNSLNKLGHKASLIGIGKPKEHKGHTIRLINAPFGKSTLVQLKLFFYLPFYIIKNDIKVVISDLVSVYSLMLLYLFRKFLRIQILLDVRTVPVESDHSLEKKFMKYCRIAKSIFDGSIFISDGVREYFHKTYNFSLKNCHIRPSGVNTELFDPGTSNNISSDYILKTKGRFVLFYHGSISKNRGLDTLLIAIDKLKATIPEILLVSVSNSNNLIQEFCQANNLDLEKHLMLINKTDQGKLPGYIKRSDFCVVPLPRITWWEVSSPLKLFEYLAMAKPVILSDIFAHTIVVPKTAQYTVYYNPDLPNDLLEKILLAYCRREEIYRHAAEARKLVEKNYTWDKQAADLVSFINNIKNK